MGNTQPSSNPQAAAVTAATDEDGHQVSSSSSVADQEEEQEVAPSWDNLPDMLQKRFEEQNAKIVRRYIHTMPLSATDQEHLVYYHPSTDEEKGNISTMLSLDVLPDIFAYMDWRDNLWARATCTKWKSAVLRTVIPPTTEMKSVWTNCGCCPPRETVVPAFDVSSVKAYEALETLKRALPNLQQINLGELQGAVNPKKGFVIGLFNAASAVGRDEANAKYEDGKDPDTETLEETQDFTSLDVHRIAIFENLRHLSIKNAPLNGSYPNLFAMPTLRSLCIEDTPNLKLELSMLSGVPLLETLEITSCPGVTGDIASLSVLKDTLRELLVHTCDNITGDFMSLADFCKLERVDLLHAASITGDVSKIDHENHFVNTTRLDLPKVIVSIAESKSIIARVIHPLAKRHRRCKVRVQLSPSSADWYADDTGLGSPQAPFCLETVFTEPDQQVGWRWTNLCRYEEDIQTCETMWFDDITSHRLIDEPQSGNGDEINKALKLYAGFAIPPTAEEYAALCSKHNELELQKRRSQMQSFSSIFGGLPGVESSRHTREGEDELDELEGNEESLEGPDNFFRYFRPPTAESYRQWRDEEGEVDELGGDEESLDEEEEDLEEDGDLDEE